MKVIKKLQKVDEKVYKHYYLELDNGKRIQIRCAFLSDLPKLDLISEFIADYKDENKKK